MSRLIVVSNRVSIPSGKKGAQGGLAFALSEALKRNGGLWFGWSGKTSDNLHLHRDTVDGVDYATVDLTRRFYADYYNGFANRMLWPLCHYRLDLTSFSHAQHQAYVQANAGFADRLIGLIEPGDPIWVHDYHMIPLGREMRDRGVKAPMGFFLHTPFPAMEVLTALPVHRDIVHALCAYDVVGFQTANDLRAFLDYIVHEAEGRILGNKQIEAFGRRLLVDVFPISVDTEEIALTAARKRPGRAAKRVRAMADTITTVVGVDRLDYSKGLPDRFEAFQRLLERYPGFRRSVSLLQIAPTSRGEVKEYKDIKDELESLSGGINARFADVDWTPIQYLNRSFPRDELFSIFRASKVGLVTPLRDGMNLVAKEYVAAQSADDPGVLVLSRFAGAARELDSALIVNPYDLDAVADAIGKAIGMPPEERRERWGAMMATLRGNTIAVWRDRFLSALSQAPYGP